MPELPEVETVRRGLEPALQGRRIVWARAYRPDLRWPLPERFAERLQGARVAGLRRRSKYLLIDLEEPGGDGAAAPETWISHLGMSGRFVIAARGEGGDDAMPGRFAHGASEAEDRRSEHDHVALATDAARIIYNDPRRFGAMDLWPTAELERHPSIARLGPEPLSNAFSGLVLHAALQGRRTRIKAALLDQSIGAGLGNIYVCEALWRSRIAPTRLSGSLSAADCELLARDIKAVLTEAIAAGGSSLKDYRQADGALGYFQHAFSAYGRAGADCSREECGGTIACIEQGGRSTFFCPECQE